MDEAWEKFKITGRVNDYLRFKGIEDNRTLSDFMAAEKEQDKRPDGTEYRNDRDGLTGYANWRL